MQQLCDRCLLLTAGRNTFDGNTDETINRYLSNYTSENVNFGETEITPSIILHNMYLTQNGIVCDQIANTKEPLQIHFEYNILEPVNNLLIGFEIFTSQGILLCRSYDEEIFGVGHRDAGHYQSVYEFPANTFQPMIYYFSLISAIHQQTPLNRNKVVFPINLIEARESAIDLPGIIKPIGFWKTANE